MLKSIFAPWRACLHLAGFQSVISHLNWVDVDFAEDVVIDKKGAMHGRPAHRPLQARSTHLYGRRTEANEQGPKDDGPCNAPAQHAVLQ